MVVNCFDGNDFADTNVKSTTWTLVKTADMARSVLNTFGTLR